MHTQYGQAIAAATQQIKAELHAAYGERIASMQRAIGGQSGVIRKLQLELGQAAGAQTQRLDHLAQLAQQTNLSITRMTEPARKSGVLRVEEIPGRRIPYVVMVAMEVGPDDTSIRQATWTVSQEGMFVATRRIAGFLSYYQLRTINNITNQLASFQGRSYGRWRPIHSAGDLLDGQGHALSDGTAWFLAADAFSAAGDVMPSATLVQPSNMSDFRSMEFDGLLEFEVGSSNWPRQNMPIGTPFYTDGAVNGGYDLSALDVFNRGEVLTWKMTPTHANNPSFGNVDGACVFPRAFAAATNQGGYPFLAGQFDAQEGICTPAAVVKGDNDGEWTTILEDVVTRTPRGIFYVGLEGYRIGQPVAPVP